MSPELKLGLLNNLIDLRFNPEKSDIFSLGLSIIKCYFLLDE